jgi:hypothetical protein
MALSPGDRIVSAEASTAFISYSRKDSAFASRLARDLKDAGADVWLDRLDIAPGELWDMAIERALSRCSRVLVILSPSSVDTRGVLDEVAFALKKRKTVIPILFVNCEIPYRLDPIQYLDFRVDYDSALIELLRVLPHKSLRERATVVMEIPNPKPHETLNTSNATGLQGEPTTFSDRSEAQYFRRTPTWVKAATLGAAAMFLLAFAIVPKLVPRQTATSMPNVPLMKGSGHETVQPERVDIPPAVRPNKLKTAKVPKQNQGRSDVTIYELRACYGGDADNCVKLGLLYELGSGVPEDQPKAFLFYRRGCDGGSIRGCRYLAEAYEVGSGITQDKTQAAALYRKACDGGDTSTCDYLRTVAP